MTINNPSPRVRGRGRTLAVAFGLGLALLANLGDRAFSASPPNSGIDPLEILNLAVKNNVFFIIDTSGSMRWPVDKDLWTMGIDDPRSRLYQARQAIKSVVAANQDKVNFGLGTYSVLQPPKALNQSDADANNGGRSTGANGGGGNDTRGPTGPFIYVSKSANAKNFYDSNTGTAALDNFSCLRSDGTTSTRFGFFCDTTNTYANFDFSGAVTADSNHQEIWQSFRNPTPPYPDNCTPGTNCFYYLESKVLRGGVKMSWDSSKANDKTGTSGTDSRFAADITAYTCPAAPAGLLGDSNPHPCVRMCDISKPAADQCADFYYSSPVFAGPSNCGNGSAVLNTVAPCSANNASAITAQMGPSIVFDGSGNPTATTVSSTQPAVTSVGTLTLNTPIDLFTTARYLFNTQGLRETGGTPLGASLRSIQCAGTGACAAYAGMPAVGAPPASPVFLDPPTEVVGRQRNFVILLTDGDDLCTGWNDDQVVTSARELYYNGCTGANNAASGGACGANSTDQRHQAETFLIAFSQGVADQTTANRIARGGSGGNINGTCPVGVPCRDAFFPTTINELNDALNQAVSAASVTGEFSDQQSVTETVFEFAASATPSKNPLLPDERYAVSVPVLLQSTFEMPGFLGHLNAFRRGDNGTPDPADDTTVPLWDAGEKLFNRVTTPTPETGMGVGTQYMFSELYGNKDPMSSASFSAGATSGAPRIRRRIYTTSQNGVNDQYTVTNLIQANTSSLAWVRLPLWPPSTGTSDSQSVAPTVTGTDAAPIRGMLDIGMGIAGLYTVADVQALVPGACQGSVAGDIHADCADATKDLARTKREAREIAIAYIAGAQLVMSAGKPLRFTATDTVTARRRELRYVARPWVLVESTLAAPGVVTPPLLAGPPPTSLGSQEYKLYRDGIHDSTGAPLNYVLNGLGLRNPDRAAASATQTVKDTAASKFDLKPSMSVVYHATNQGLHAFRAGPCPTATSGSGFGGASLGCQSGPGGPELGGEELWAFVPFDQLSKLAALTKPQNRNNKTYLLAAPVRFSDIFVPGTVSAPTGYVPGGSTPTPTGTMAGVWRTILYFGRGQGGNYYSALDVTVPGPFTRHSLMTEAPVVVWNRGNPDTIQGVVGGTPSYSATDTTAYQGMGETWSVPAVGYVTAANYTTARTGTNGINFALFTGSGYSDVSGEGKWFFVLDALTGDIFRRYEVQDGSPAPPPAVTPPAVADYPLTNFLVAPPVVYSENSDGNSPSGYRFIGNPISAKAKAVYFPDLHGRVFRFDAVNPPSAGYTFTTTNAFFANNAGTNGNQPFATAVAVLQERPDTALPGKVYVFLESGHDRRVTPQAAKPFKAYAFEDVAGVRSDLFAFPFGTGFRGATQPAAAFAGATLPPTPVVFYAGVKYNPPVTLCVSSFDSVIAAFKAVVPPSPATPVPAFDLRATGDDSFIDLVGQKVNAIRVSGEGNLVVDTGLNAQNAPPPPGVSVPPETTATSSSLVTVGLVPGSQAYKDLSSTTVPYRVGSSVCRTN